MPPSGNSRPPPASPAAPVTEAEVCAEDLTEGSGLQSEPSDPSERENRIREAAYQAYERRGGQPGHEDEDWLEAEKALTHRSGGNS